MIDWEAIAREFAKALYDSIAGDMNDPTDALQLMQYTGFTDEDGDWIYIDPEPSPATDEQTFNSKKPKS